jgi:hypothetical protein
MKRKAKLIVISAAFAPIIMPGRRLPVFVRTAAIKARVAILSGGITTFVRVSY